MMLDISMGKLESQIQRMADTRWGQTGENTGSRCWGKEAVRRLPWVACCETLAAACWARASPAVCLPHCLYSVLLAPHSEPQTGNYSAVRMSVLSCLCAGRLCIYLYAHFSPSLQAGGVPHPHQVSLTGKTLKFLEIGEPTGMADVLYSTCRKGKRVPLGSSVLGRSPQMELILFDGIPQLWWYRNGGSEF